MDKNKIIISKIKKIYESLIDKDKIYKWLKIRLKDGYK